MEFKVPKKYDNDFRRGEEGECSEDTDDNKSAITTSSQQNTPSQGKTNRSSPVKKLHKMYRKQLENTPGGKNLPSKESSCLLNGCYDNADLDTTGSWNYEIL